MSLFVAMPFIYNPQDKRLLPTTLEMLDTSRTNKLKAYSN